MYRLGQGAGRGRVTKETQGSLCPYSSCRSLRKSQVRDSKPFLGKETQFGEISAISIQYVIPVNSPNNSLGCMASCTALCRRQRQGSVDLNELPDHMAKKRSAPRRPDLKASAASSAILFQHDLNGASMGQGDMVLSYLPSFASLPHFFSLSPSFSLPAFPPSLTPSFSPSLPPSF